MTKTQKRIMILGGNYVQAEATKTAKRLGYYVISADLHEDNPGHSIANEYCKVDITDKEAVLHEAQRLEIDGVIPYCSDILAPVAAYVQEQMGLPGNPCDVVNIMTHKDQFRDFMRKNGFLAPRSTKVMTLDEAVSVIERAEGNHAFMMKPTDNAGSRGVFKVCNADDIKKHWEETIGYSSSRSVLIEDFIESVGRQQDGDIFVIDGEIAYWGMCDQYKQPDHPFMIASEVFPSTQDLAIQHEAKDIVQSILKKLRFRQGPCNVEYIIDNQKRIWILEIGPRNGGMLIPFLIEKSTGIDLTELTLRQAVGERVSIPTAQHLCYAMSIVHPTDGKTVDLELKTGDKPLKP